jgi:hypothetical protein
MAWYLIKHMDKFTFTLPLHSGNVVNKKSGNLGCMTF